MHAVKDGSGSIAGRFNYADVDARRRAGVDVELETSKAMLEKAARKGQWYKFHDETVMKVYPVLPA